MYTYVCINSDILSSKCADILFGILSGIYSDILFGILSGIFSGIHSRFCLASALTFYLAFSLKLLSGMSSGPGGLRSSLGSLVTTSRRQDKAERRRR